MQRKQPCALKPMCAPMVLKSSAMCFLLRTLREEVAGMAPRDRGPPSATGPEASCEA